MAHISILRDIFASKQTNHLPRYTSTFCDKHIHLPRHIFASNATYQHPTSNIHLPSHISTFYFKFIYLSRHISVAFGTYSAFMTQISLPWCTLSFHDIHSPLMANIYHSLTHLHPQMEQKINRASTASIMVKYDLIVLCTSKITPKMVKNNQTACCGILYFS